MSIKVLIVDDDEVFLKDVQGYLKTFNIESEAVNRGQAALEIVSKFDGFDALVTDLVMGDMSGGELIREVKKLRPDLPVVVVTGFPTIDTAVDSIKSGAVEYVSKPLKSYDFCNKIKKVIEEKRLQENRTEQYINPLFTSAAALRCISHPKRTMILNLLYERDGPMRFTEIRESLGFEDPPNLSFHLKALLKHKILTQNKEKAYFLTPFGKKICRGLKNLR
jgi:ActR/RegA family two-component response regulator